MGVGLGGGTSYGFAQKPQSNFWNWAGENIPGFTDLAPVGQTILEGSIPTAFSNLKATLGIKDDSSAFSRWFDQQLSRYTLGYNNYTAANPLDASIGGYNATLGGIDGFLRDFNRQAPQLRGLDPASRGGGPARWVGR